MTLIQRFGPALKLNVHVHILFLDGAHLSGARSPVFRRIAPPSAGGLETVVARIAARIGRSPEHEGLLYVNCCKQPSFASRCRGAVGVTVNPRSLALVHGL